MDHNIYRGLLERWNDDKGFGFVRPENASREVFIHISALENMGRRPVVGDIISFRVETDGNGKTRAINASIAGVPVIKPRQKNTRGNRRARQSSSHFVLVLVVIIGVAGYAGFDNWRSRQAVETGHPEDIVAPVYETRDIVTPVYETQDTAMQYQCDGREHCSEMTSCEEAKFFIRNCPNTKMDGDGDGVPCERQLCNRW